MSFSVRPFNSKETLLLSDKRPVFSYVVCTKQRCLHQNFCVYYTEHYLTKNISLCQFLRYYKFSSDSYFRVVMIQIFIFWNIALHGGTLVSFHLSHITKNLVTGGIRTHDFVNRSLVPYRQIISHIYFEHLYFIISKLLEFF